MQPTSSHKPWAIVVVIVILALLAWIFLGHHASTPAGTAETGQVPAPQSTGNSDEGNTSVSATDTSDAALNQDMANVDAQMNGLDSDNANADQSLSQSSQ